jgi:threonine/homoserine/homoserine lactone efflux protein
MGAAIGQVLPYAVGVALSPLPIVAVVLMLSTPRGRTNGPAFVAGWVLGLAVVGAILLLISSGASASSHDKPATWLSVVKLLGGLALVFVAYRQFQRRPRRGEEPRLPSWMRGIDKLDWRRSLGLGVGLSAINPKNLVLIIGASAAIAQAGIGAGEQVVAYVVFVIVATLGLAIPVGIYFGMGTRGAHVLDELRTRMARDNSVIISVICLLLAAKLIGDAITGLAS